ncbi:MAG: hypothetical protein ABSA84_02330 [Gammaproteobacteria bacterium]|jgi:hypothetical protein
MIVGLKGFYKYNLKLKIIFIIFIAAINTVYADGGGIVKPYLGGEYRLSYTQAEESWDRLLPTNKPNSNSTIFYGICFYDYIAGEINYTKSNRNTKYSDVSGWNMFGTIARSGSQQKVQLSYTNYGLDLNGQYPGGDGFSLLGTIGIAAIKPKLEIVNIGAIDTPVLDSSGNPVNNSAGVPEINIGNESVASITGKSKLALRLGVGFQYAKGMFGIRSRLVWEDASMLRVNTGSYNQILPDVTEVPFRNTFSWSLGFFIRFL